MEMTVIGVSPDMQAAPLCAGRAMKSAEVRYAPGAMDRTSRKVFNVPIAEEGRPHPAHYQVIDDLRSGMNVS
jgi:hypothetical protein